MPEKAGRLRRATAAFLSGFRHRTRRAWQIAKLRKAEAPPIKAGALANRLGEEKTFLLSLIGEMETEFLATGEGLAHLARQLAEIQHECQSLAELTLGQAPDAAVQFAFQLLKKAEDLVLASCDQYDHVFGSFSELQQRLAQLSQQHNELMRVLLPLNFITMSLRIEASRQPAEVQAVFVSLVTDLNQTVNDVRGTLERQFENLAAGERIVRNLVGEVSVSIQRHREEVASALAESRHHLRALSEALTSSGAGAAGLSHLNQAVTRHIGGIVMAQQCQDITRQKIDHVAEAMDQMRAHLDEAQPGISTADSDARPFVLRAGQIQLQQIQAVFDDLNRAADGLKSGIQNLRAEAGAAGAAAVKVGATTLHAKTSNLCQAGITRILAIIDQAVQGIADILAAFEPLQATFVNCTTKAADLAGDVRQAALNAQIFAIHAPDGATLELLAGRVSAVSDEAIEQLGQMGAALHHTAEMVSNLRQRLADFSELGQAEREALNEESTRSKSKLADLDSAVPRLVDRITRQQVAFVQSVEAVLAKVRFPATVAAASSRSVGFFHELVVWSGQGDAHAVIASAAEVKIDRLQANYTMESERQAHAAGLRPVLTAARASAGQPAIELFDDVEPVSLTAAGSPAEVLSRGEPPAEQPNVAGSTGVAAPRIQSFSHAAQRSAASVELGDNVELF